MTRTSHPETAVRAELSFHAKDLLRLAWPVMLSRAGILVMAFADIAMLGRYSDQAVGVSNLGIAIFVPIIVVSIGLVSGMVPVVSQAYGARQWQECGHAWRRAMSWGLFVSLLGAVACFYGEAVLVFARWSGLDLDPDQIAEAGAVCVALAPGVVGQVLFAACAFYLESVRRPMFALLAMLTANLVNVALNWVMIFGNLGWPEMGAEGAAWASTIARFVSFGALLWIILALSGGAEAGLRGPWGSIWGPGGWRAGRMMRKLGASAGLSNGFETIGFAAMMMFAGTLGTAALAAYAISHNLVSTLFMIGLGLAVATGVRVGQATGAGEPRNAALAGWTGLLVAFVIMGSLMVLVLAFRDEVAAIYTDDPALAARTAGVLAVSAFIFLPDCLQVVMGQAIRALGDAWVAVGCYILSFVGIMVPMGYWLTRGGPAMDERGLVLAIIAACIVATVLLCWRFWMLTRRVR